MAVDIFLKLEGITGEARDNVADCSHRGEIDVLAWSWGMTLKINRSGPGRAPDIEHLIITKYVDRATPALMTALARVTKFPKATLVCRKAGGDKPLEFLKIAMTDAIVTAVRPDGMGANDRFTEQIALDFAKVTVTYQEQDDKGISKGGSVEFEHSMKSNV